MKRADNYVFRGVLIALSWILFCGSMNARSFVIQNDREGERLEAPHDWVDYVNPYMGNISHLLVPTYPTIHLPNSMLRVYPERGDFTGDLLNGLPIAVTSHRGSSAFNLSVFQGEETEVKGVVPYSYDRERISPYDYFVYLDEEEVSVYYAVSHQSGIYELKFDRKEAPFLILNSRRGELKWDGKAFSGYQQLQNNTRIYLYMEPDMMPQRVVRESASGAGAHVVLAYPEDTRALKLRYGISFIDEEQARKNLYREMDGFDAKAVAEKGRAVWNETLGKIAVEGGSEDDRAVFYTSLYRTYERPVCISEDGRYFSAFDGKVHEDEGTPFYTDDWIWDTYRATHPLRVLVEAEMETDILHSFLRMSEQMPEFWWPTFPEITGDSRRMNSNHGIATVIDGYRKGLEGIDLEKKYPALRDAVMEKTLAPWSAKPSGELDRFYHEHGYIPALREGEEETIPEVHGFERRQPVAVTLGTAYDEWCLALIAKELGKAEDYAFFLEKSYNYRNLFNAETGFFHPKDKEGNFIEPFDYRFSGGMGAREYYGENNAWVYRWDVLHNVEDLVYLMGGRDQFIRNLDQTFREPLGRSKYAFYAQLPDHTGNVGQFSMANEPSLHIPYLYNYAGQPWKTQKRIRDLVNEWFRNDLMGVPGDEDGGGMSAFVVFSQMGFYPVTPGDPSYNIGSPFFDEVKMTLSNGKVLRIVASNNSKENKYIQSARLNGQEWTKPWFSHDDIKDGGTLELVMGEKANRAWGAAPEDVPPSVGVYSSTFPQSVAVASNNQVAPEEGGLAGKRVLYVYGGWEGHEPEQCRDLFVPWLKEEGAEVMVRDDLDCYDDAQLMNSVDLIVQHYTMGELSGAREKALCDAVKRGVGLAGWHGGTGDSFRNNTEYQYMVGGQFVSHPGGIIPYTVNIEDESDLVTRGLKHFNVVSEQYYLHVDPSVQVLASTTFTGDHDPWIEGVVMPVVWKKRYGEGKVFYSSLGHVASDFDVFEVFEITKRGIRWAAR